MIELVNRNHYEACEAEYVRLEDDRKARREVLKQLDASWKKRCMKAVTFACIGIGCAASALGGMYPSLMLPLGAFCGAYSAGIFGGLAQERRSANA